ncbi:hypothetical protein HYW73_03130 [Candidatus Nomurabacteria bacterium]|nr:hypothetical protein [Candidatus Nomurabacteria bacterium]
MENKTLESFLKIQKQQALGLFLRYKNAYSEKIPEGIPLEEFLRDKEKSDLCKLTESFFNRVSLGATMLINRNLIKDPKAIKRCEEFKQFVAKLKKEKFDQRKLADIEDVAVADEFIGYIIGELQK